MQSDELLKLDHQLCFAIYSANLAFNQVYRKLLKPLGLTYPQYLVMMTLWENNGLSVSQIGTLLHLESSTLTPMLKRMEMGGLIERKRSSVDERQVFIYLTSEGDVLKQKAQQVPLSMQRLSECQLDDFSALKNQLHTLSKQLQEKS